MITNLEDQYKHFKGAITLDRIASERIRRIMRRTACIAAIVTFILGIYTIFVLALLMWLKLLLFECMYVSYRSECIKEGISFELLSLYRDTSGKSALEAWATSIWGEYILIRLGIGKLPKNSLVGDLGIRREEVFNSDVTDLGSLASRLYDLYPAFREALLSHFVGKDDLVEVSSWVSHHESEKIKKKLWLSKERLGHVPRIGAAFSYGKVFALEKYGREVFGEGSEESRKIFARSLSLLSGALEKSKGANALIVGSSGDETISYMEAAGSVLHGKRIFILDGLLLVSTTKAKPPFEEAFRKILKESAEAGNIVLAISSFPSFVESAHEIGSDIIPIIASYLGDPNLHVVLLSDRRGFHATLEPRREIVGKLDKIELDQIPDHLVRAHLLDVIVSIEGSRHVFFLYPAIEVILEALIRLSSDPQSERMVEDASSYIDECALYGKRMKLKIIGKAVAEEFIAEKTGISRAEVSGSKEAEKLLHLEEELRKRVIGQDDALVAVANAMRRLKAGVVSPNRPVASFLFVGPTGVGKTETAKALAEMYFGDESKMIRLDMSEYGGKEGLPKLIGSFAQGEEGLLAIKARDAVHGVFLVDELEKADREVLDIFLQILDEGYFTDSRGERVNMKNFIIIATSNAGKDLNSVVASGLIRKELLNRFDAVIAFASLAGASLREVAKLALEKYSKRLYHAKSIELRVTDELAEFVASKIKDDSFGGRAINRVITDEVESLIAKEILGGGIMSGSAISLAPDSGGKTLHSVYIKDTKNVPELFIHKN